MNNTLEKETVIDINLNDPSKSLNQFLKDWDNRYNDAIKGIDLFKEDFVKSWSVEQKRLFVSVFYHLRGHFAEFLWYMGSFAPNKSAKELIIGNIVDEFNYNGMSHDQLFLHFASMFDLDLTYELLDNKYYLPFARSYIEGQLRWLRDNNWESRLAGFAAIERLDNVDYLNYKTVAENMGATGSYLTFFNVHINADHFESILNNHLLDLWINSKDTIVNVFQFILEYQINMLQEFSDIIAKK
jgi:hypothetical protein